MGKSKNKEDAFNTILSRLIVVFEGLEFEDILADEGEDFTEEALQEAFDQVHDAVYTIKYQGHGTYVDPQDTQCALCQKKKSQRTMSTYQVQGMRLTVCRNCVRDLIEQEIMSL